MYRYLARPPAALAFGAAFLAVSGAAFGACTGPGAPTNTETKCLTAVQIPGAPLRSYDISWVNPQRAEYYLADRSNAAIDIIDTRKLSFNRFLDGSAGNKGKSVFVGVKLNSAGTAVNNDISGPDGVVTHGRWLYAGDGDSTLKVFDLNGPNALAQPDAKATRPRATTSVSGLYIAGDWVDEGGILSDAAFASARAAAKAILAAG